MTGATIPGSSEAFKCTYVTMPPTAGFIVGGKHEYTVGSHHLLLYRTDLASVPAGLASPTVGDCYGTTDYMSHISGVVYPAQTPHGSLAMPDGVGLPYKANEVFLFQVHYLNSSAAPLHPEVYVQLTTQSTPVKQNAGVLFFYAPFIYVPQGAKATASNRCAIPANITMFTEGSHYHARGVGYRAYLDPSPSAPSATPFYTSSDWESPPTQLTSIPVSAGSDIRYYCDYDNTQGTQDFIQGPSAASNEMCMFVGLYYPAMATADEQCLHGDMYGTESTSCIDSLKCLGTCPPQDPDAGASADFDACTQKCFVQSCPESTGALIGVSTCIQSSCSSECSGADAGATCSSCVGAKCLTEYQACSSAACGTVPGP